MSVCLSVCHTAKVAAVRVMASLGGLSGMVAAVTAVLVAMKSGREIVSYSVMPWVIAATATLACEWIVLSTGTAEKHNAELV